MMRFCCGRPAQDWRTPAHFFWPSHLNNSSALALLLWRSIDGACAIRAIEDNSRKVIAHLLQSAPTYRPESYSYLSVVGIVKPLAAIVPYKERFAHDLRFMLYLFLVQHSLIAVIYLPLFIIVLRILRRQISPKESRENGFAGDHTPKEMNAIDRVRKRLIKHACLVYLQEILYCPPVVYLMFGPTTKVSKLSDPTWILVLQVGVHGPTAIIGNM
ncbi:hypothetical protein MJO29_009013 [Puccinia striiformis f. sp. tritici]|nr:hypothetical protein MJO29_009013 [Puccinia striiformis f. sp. tritici]